jgi:hypothetical protein
MGRLSGYALFDQNHEHKNMIKRFDLSLRPAPEGVGYRLIVVVIGTSRFYDRSE